MIKNLVFDFGGIIADFEFSRALAAFERVGLKNPAEYLDSYHQRGFFRELESGRIGGRRIRPAAGRVRRSGGELCRGARGVAGVLPAAGFARTTGLFGGVAPRLPALCAEQHQSLRDGLGAQQRIFACRKAARRLFRQVVPLLRDEVHETRSAIFDRMAAEAPLVPAETLFIDDSAANAAAGAALGYRTFCPRSNSDWREEVRRILGAGV